LQTRGLAKSIEGLNSSLAQSTGELSYKRGVKIWDI